ncbi:MAG: PH domain-containing protein [Myxococcota bacterium]
MSSETKADDSTSSGSEKKLWSGTPSQLTAFRFHLVCGVLGASLLFGSIYAVLNNNGIALYAFAGAVFFALAAAIKYFIVRSTAYSLTSERLIVETGILSRSSEEIELYRVKDWSVMQPLLLRMFGHGHVRITSNDATAPELILMGISKPENLRDLVRTHVEASRDKKRVRHFG